MKIANLKDLLKEKEEVRDWSTFEMSEAILNGYLLYYWSIYKHHEEDRRAS